MSVRCKFTVSSTTQHAAQAPVYDEAGKHSGYKPAIMHTIKLSPVYGNGDINHENTKFWAASPSGQIEFGWINEEAAKQLEIGKEYYIDITPAN